MNHNQRVTEAVNHSGCDPGVGATISRTKMRVVSTLPISTTNMTGFLMTFCGASLRKLSHTAGRMISGSKSESSLFMESAILKDLSILSQKVLNNRTKRQGREEGQRT